MQRNPILPHLTIVLAGMLLVLFVLDRVNPAMDFIHNDITKALLFALTLLALASGVRLARHGRRK